MIDFLIIKALKDLKADYKSLYYRKEFGCMQMEIDQILLI